MEKRYGKHWMIENPERVGRLSFELELIERLGFPEYFLILARILDFCRKENIAYGPGRGSVGGCYTAFAIGAHEVDSLEWGLLFERFLTAERVTWPDVDIDISQRHRQRVLKFIRTAFEDEHHVVLQVAAFARASGRSVIDMMLAAHPEGGATAENLRKCLPEGNITGGTKQPRELAFWLEQGKSGNQERFIELATQADWLSTMLKLDGIQTNLAKHAAGVVILSREDLTRLPQCGSKNTTDDSWNMMTGYDMYALEDLDYLKYDILGLRTLDLLSDADKTIGGDGSTKSLMDLWKAHKDDRATYDLLSEGNTLGVFQVETGGYRRTLKSFEPREFDHIVQLNALYRPGALDYRRDDGKNMVEVFIERRHGREQISYSHSELYDVLHPILGKTQGIILYQEQAMQIAIAMAGFTGYQSDALRKAIGKKKRKAMEDIHASFVQGCLDNGYSKGAAEATWENIAAAARYSWNLSHSVEYGILTFLCAWFKANHPAAYYTAYINSWSEKKERQSEGIAEARQRVKIVPPDINVAMGDYTVSDGNIVFGLNGIKGMGEANRAEIIINRELLGPFANFEEFHKRLPSVPINMKLSLIKCGAFDNYDRRDYLLAEVPTKGKNLELWTVAEHLKHSAGLKKPRELPPITEWVVPSDADLAQGEIDTIGFYVSADPMSDVTKTLARLDPSMHWGGTVEYLKTKRDKRGQEYANATLLTNALTKVRLLIFASIYSRVQEMLKQKGTRIIVRGHTDGGQVIVDGLFYAGDYRHFRVLWAKRGDEDEIKEPFDGKLETIERFEESGYTVKVL